MVVTHDDVRRRARVALILRARIPRDGDGDGFYDPDGKGPLPDRTPMPRTSATAAARPSGGSRSQRQRVDFDAAIQSGVKDRESLSGGQMSTTHLVRYNNGTTLVAKRMHYAAAWASAEQQADAEHLAAVLGQAIGAPVPRTHRVGRDTVLMEVAPGRTELAHFLDAETAGNVAAHDKVRQAAIDSDMGRLLGVLDLLIDNDDRNSGNWLLDDAGRPHGIDHALSWDPQRVYGGAPDLRLEESDDGDGYVIVGPDGPLPDVYDDEVYARGWIESWWLLDGLALAPVGTEPPRYKDGGTLSPFASALAEHLWDGEHRWIPNDLSPADVEWLKGRLERVRPQFEALGRLDWYEFARGRLEALGRHARGTRTRWAA